MIDVEDEGGDAPDTQRRVSNWRVAAPVRCSAGCTSSSLARELPSTSLSPTFPLTATSSELGLIQGPVLHLFSVNFTKTHSTLEPDLLWTQRLETPVLPIGTFPAFALCRFLDNHDDLARAASPPVTVGNRWSAGMPHGSQGRVSDLLSDHFQFFC